MLLVAAALPVALQVLVVLAVVLQAQVVLAQALAVLVAVALPRRQFSLDGHTLETEASWHLSSTNSIALFKSKQSVCRISALRLDVASDSVPALRKLCELMLLAQIQTDTTSAATTSRFDS